MEKTEEIRQRGQRRKKKVGGEVGVEESRGWGDREAEEAIPTRAAS